MKVISVKHKTDIIKGECPFADSVKNEVLTLLHFCNPISKDHTNVKASIHTEWYWEPNNIIFKNLKHHILMVIEGILNPILFGVMFMRKEIMLGHMIIEHMILLLRIL